MRNNEKRHINMLKTPCKSGKLGMDYANSTDIGTEYVATTRNNKEQQGTTVRYWQLARRLQCYPIERDNDPNEGNAMTITINAKTLATAAVVLGLGSFFVYHLVSLLITFKTVVGS